MTVIHGEIYPDHEFPTQTWGYHADRDAVHDFGNPLRTKDEVMKSALRHQDDPKTYRLRVAHYVLVEVTEIECAGERPDLPVKSFTGQHRA